jgi:hypothetical protein
MTRLGIVVCARRLSARTEALRGRRLLLGRSRRSAIAGCVLVALAACLGGCGLDHRQQVRVGIQQLTSIAAEGALMADDLAKGRTTTTFIRVHGNELSAQAEHEAEKLNDDSIPRGLETRAKIAIALASDIGGAIDDFITSPQDRARVRQDRGKLRKWAVQANRLADSV